MASGRAIDATRGELTQTMYDQVKGYRHLDNYSNIEIGQLLDDFMELLKNQPFPLVARMVSSMI